VFFGRGSLKLQPGRLEQKGCLSSPDPVTSKGSKPYPRRREATSRLHGKHCNIPTPPVCNLRAPGSSPRPTSTTEEKPLTSELLCSSRAASAFRDLTDARLQAYSRRKVFISTTSYTSTPSYAANSTVHSYAIVLADSTVIFKFFFTTNY